MTLLRKDANDWLIFEAILLSQLRSTCTPYFLIHAMTQLTLNLSRWNSLCGLQVDTDSSEYWM